MSAGSPRPAQTLRFLPDDAVRSILWRFEDRAGLRALALAARQASSEAAGVTPGAIDALAASSAGGAASLGLALVAFELASTGAGSAAPADTPELPAAGVGLDSRQRNVAAGIMPAARLLAAVAPVLHHRADASGRLAGPAGADVAHRVIDIWATGEAAAALGFEAARVLDQVATAGQQAGAAGDAPDAWARARQDAVALLAESARPQEKRNAARVEALTQDPLVRRVRLESLASVLCPAVKVWNTGHGADVLREAVSLAGGSGRVPGGPGTFASWWCDARLDAGVGASALVQRAALAGAMVDEVFIAQYRAWVDDMRQVASDRPGTGACLLASVMQMWLWALQHLRKTAGADGRPLLRDDHPGVTLPMADALCWILSSHQQIQDVFELERRGASAPAVSAQLPDLLPLLTDLCHVQAARAAGEVGRMCAEVLYGYRPHPAWDREGCATCYVADELDALDEVIPGMGAAARFYGDVIEADGSHPAKAGPCAHIDGLEPFLRMRTKVDGCLTGCRVAKDRVAGTLTRMPGTAR